MLTVKSPRYSFPDEPAPDHSKDRFMDTVVTVFVVTFGVTFSYLAYGMEVCVPFIGG